MDVYENEAILVKNASFLTVGPKTGENERIIAQDWDLWPCQNNNSCDKLFSDPPSHVLNNEKMKPMAAASHGP